MYTDVNLPLSWSGREVISWKRPTSEDLAGKFCDIFSRCLTSCGRLPSPSSQSSPSSPSSLSSSTGIARRRFHGARRRDGDRARFAGITGIQEDDVRESRVTELGARDSRRRTGAEEHRPREKHSGGSGGGAYPHTQPSASPPICDVSRACERMSNHVLSGQEFDRFQEQRG